VTKAGLTDVEGQDKKNKTSLATETKETIGVRYLIKAQERFPSQSLVCFGVLNENRI
jgi:hypothetical protein